MQPPTEHGSVCGARSLTQLGYDSECLLAYRHFNNHVNSEGRQWFNLSDLARFDEEEETDNG